MKKLYSLLSLLLVFVFLSSCSHSEFLNLASFTENFSVLMPLDLTDFIKYQDESGEPVYLTYINCDGNTVLLKLLAEDDLKIKECRVSVSKYDEKGKKIKSFEEIKNSFQNVCSATISAYTYLNIEESDKIIGKLDITKNFDKKNFEKTYENGSFNFAFLSNDLCLELIIKNKWINEIETTQKPENKNDFANNTSIRTETVPLQ